MLTPCIAVFGGLVFLSLGADRFVLGAAALARNTGVSPLLIGLTIVGFGTSAPEILVSAVAAAQDNPALGIGNAIGSNIANVTLVLGAAMCIRPLRIKPGVLSRELPLLLVATLLATVLMLDSRLTRVDGTVLLIAMVTVGAWMVREGLRASWEDQLRDEWEHHELKALETPAALTWLLVGLVVLLVASRVLVYGAVEIATYLGVTDLVIGLTIVAVGTSLPELAAGIAAARRRETELVLGNVIGSNVFNSLAVVAMPALIRPSHLAPEIVSRDLPVMIAVTGGLFAFALVRQAHPYLGRSAGLVALAVFCAYQWFLVVMS